MAVKVQSSFGLEMGEQELNNLILAGDPSMKKENSITAKHVSSTSKNSQRECAECAPHIAQSEFDKHSVCHEQFFP